MREELRNERLRSGELLIELNHVNRRLLDRMVGVVNAPKKDSNHTEAERVNGRHTIQSRITRLETENANPEGEIQRKKQSDSEYQERIKALDKLMAEADAVQESKQ